LPPFSDSPCVQLRLTFLFRVLTLSPPFFGKVRPNWVFPPPQRYGRRARPRVARAPPFPFTPPFSLFCVRLDAAEPLRTSTHLAVAKMGTSTAMPGLKFVKLSASAGDFLT
jgi:hypothetical protein